MSWLPPVQNFPNLLQQQQLFQQQLLQQQQKQKQQQQQQQQQQGKQTSRCTKSYLANDTFIDFRKIRDDFDIRRIFDWYSIGRYMNYADAQKKIYIKKCEKRTLNKEKQDKCRTIYNERNKAYKLAYNILSTYLKKNTLKQMMSGIR